MKSRLTAAIATAVLAALLVATPGARAADTGDVPEFVATVGGPGLAEYYTSGLEATADGGAVVADTGNDRVVRLDSNGDEVWSFGVHGYGSTGLYNPRDVGIDADGNIYVADTGRSRIVKLTSDGTYVKQWRGPIGSPIGVTAVGNDIIVADGGTRMIRVFDQDGNETAAIGATTCPFERIRDVTRDSAGNYYVANYVLDNVLKIAPDGTCLDSFGTGGTGPLEFANPYGVAIAVDPHLGELLYVSDSNNNRVQVLELDGTFVAEVGSFGDFDDPGTTTFSRRVAVGPTGDIWISDLWGTRVVRWERTATDWVFDAQFGTAQQTETDAALNSPHGMTFTAAGDLVVADRVHHRLLTYNPQGELVDVCGERGFDPTHFNWPRDVAVDTATGQRWVADTNQDRLHIVPADCSFGVFIGSTGGDLGEFLKPGGIAIRDTDRIAFVADSQNHRLVSIDVASRAVIAELDGVFLDPRGVTIDPSTGNVLVADRRHDRIVEIASADGTTFTLVDTHEAGFFRPEGVAVDADGRIYVADTENDRVVVLDATGAEIGTFDGPDGLFEPTSVSVGPDGTIYVSDTYNDRIQTYNWDGDVAAPIATFDSPAKGAEVPDGDLVLEGTAADNVGVAAVDLAIRDRVSGLWFDPITDTFGDFVRFGVPLGAPGEKATAWTYVFDGAAVAAGSGDYFAVARATDVNGNLTVSHPTSRWITVGEDTVDPDTTLTTPARRAEFPSGPVTIAGAATDNQSVAAVEVALRDRVNDTWWNPATGSFGDFGWFPASVDGTGTDVDWSVSFDGAAAEAAGGSGDYWAMARAFDTAGNNDKSRPSTRFLVQDSAPADTVDPDTTIDAPERNTPFPLGDVELVGMATDDTGVTEVEVAVLDRSTDLWWNATTGSFGDFGWSDASVSDPGAAATGWSFVFDGQAALDAGGSGDYWAMARAFDAARNQDLDRPSTRFTVAGEPDTVEPDTTFDTPVQGSDLPDPVVTLAGTATDDFGVANVELAVRDRVAGEWWDPATGNFGPFVRFPIDVAEPGKPSTAWSHDFDFAAAGGSGSYFVVARAVDTSGNNETSTSSTYFTVDLPTSTDPTYLRDFAVPGTADITPVDVAVNDTHIYALDVAQYRIARILRATGEIDASVGGTRSAEPGLLAAARAIALDSAGNVYIADTPNARVSKYDADLNFIGDFGTKGPNVGQFTQVYGLAIGTGDLGGGTMGELIYSIDGDGRITRWNLDGSLIGYFAPGTPFNQARMAEIHPTTKNLWVVNARDREIVELAPDGTEVKRFGGRGDGPGEFDGDPRGLAISADGSRIYISDEGNRRVQAFDTTGAYVGQFGAPSPGTEDYLVDVRGIDVSPEGQLVASDEWDYSVKLFDESTFGFVEKLFGAQAPVGGVNSPRGMTLDSQGRVYVSDWWNQRIGRWNEDGSGAFAWGFRGTVDEPGSVNFAWDVAAQPGTDRIFLANRESHEIEVFESDGTYVTRWGNRGHDPGEVEFPHGVVFDNDGTLLVADSNNDRIQRFAIDAAGNGTFVESYGSTGTAAGEFDTPTGVDVAADGTIWVADTANERVQFRDPDTGVWTELIKPVNGSARYRRPWGVTVAPDGTVWITDSGVGRIVHLEGDSTFLAEYTGEDLGAGPLAQPFDLLVLGNGNLLVSDTFNNRIIELGF